jgi:hypothetical protein
MIHPIIRRRVVVYLAAAMLPWMALPAAAQEIKERTLKFAFSLSQDHPMGVRGPARMSTPEAGASGTITRIGRTG